jgi:hypothetical protein
MNSQLDSVVRDTDANRAFYERFCRSLSNDELETVIPGMTWRVKDYISHLASIDLYVGEWFEHHADGTPWRPAVPGGGPFNIDTWNEDRITERRDRDLDALFGEAADLRARLWAAVDRFTDAQLAQTFPFHGADTSFLRYLPLRTAHDPAHTVDMLKGLPAERRDAEVDAWLAKYRM